MVNLPRREPIFTPAQGWSIWIGGDWSNGVVYPIHQSSTINNVLNYFQDPLKVGYLKIKNGDNNNSIIQLDQHINALDFILDPCVPSCDPITPLTINGTGIIVRGKIITKGFQLLTDPGISKILVSDNDGNGTWQDVSSLYDRSWIRTLSDDLYANCTNNVGVGTQTPMAKFQVNGGPEKVGLGSASSRELLNGTGYLGFNAARYSHLSGSRWIFSSNNEGHNGGSVMFSDIIGNLYFAPVASNGPGSSDQTLTDEQIRSNIKMTIDKSGNVGIGTLNPSRSLEICHKDETGGLILNQINENYNTTEIRFEKNSNEKFALGYTVSNDRPAFFIWNNLFGQNGKTALFIAANNMTGINTEWPSAMLDVDGDFKASRIGIGVNAPPYWDSYKLWVEGGIAAREIKVTAGILPDYVFEKKYSLMPLDSLNAYILKEKHLPDIPSQADIEKEGGVKLGELQLKLLRKIEEQSLYIISLQKQINEIRKQMNSSKGS